MTIRIIEMSEKEANNLKELPFVSIVPGMAKDTREVEITSVRFLFACDMNLTVDTSTDTIHIPISSFHKFEVVKREIGIDTKRQRRQSTYYCEECLEKELKKWRKNLQQTLSSHSEQDIPHLAECYLQRISQIYIDEHGQEIPEQFKE